MMKVYSICSDMFMGQPLRKDGFYDIIAENDSIFSVSADRMDALTPLDFRHSKKTGVSCKDDSVISVYPLSLACVPAEDRKNYLEEGRERECELLEDASAVSAYCCLKRAGSWSDAFCKNQISVKIPKRFMKADRPFPDDPTDAPLSIKFKIKLDGCEYEFPIDKKAIHKCEGGYSVCMSERGIRLGYNFKTGKETKIKVSDIASFFEREKDVRYK